MTPADVARLRLRTHRLSGAPFASAEDAISHFGAVQSQDYPAALWALSLRTGLGAGALDAAFAKGRFLRTHVLRPTWHFVAPVDLRWMLELTADRVRMKLATRDRPLGIDAALIAKVEVLVAKALDAGPLTRTEIAEVLESAGIEAGTGEEGRMGHLLGHLELNRLVCSGPMRGKQHTYALFDSRVKKGKPLARSEALMALALRYFASHGPATAKDFAWWSGLTLTDARIGFEEAGRTLECMTTGGSTYLFAGDAASAKRGASAQLLPNYDEFIVAYEDRSATLVDVPADKLDARGNVLFNHTLVLDGRVVGTWRRTLAAKTVAIEATTFRRFSAAEREVFALAADRYGEHLGRAAQFVFV